MAELKERTITIRLTDQDNMKLLMKAGECDLSVADLIQSFVCDLVGSDYSMGSDERMYADKWFRRSNIAHFGNRSFLVYLCESHLIETVMDNLESIDIIMKYTEELKQKLADPEYPWDQVVISSAAGEFPAYHSYEEWKTDALETIDGNSDDIKIFMEEIKEIWEDYRKEKYSASKGFEADINSVREWYIRNTRNMQADFEKGIR